MPDSLPGVRSYFIDKSLIQRVVAEQNERLGFVPDPTATAEKAQEMVAELLRAKGIRPDENIFSCGVIAAREE